MTSPWSSMRNILRQLHISKASIVYRSIARMDEDSYEYLECTEFDVFFFCVCLKVDVIKIDLSQNLRNRVHPGMRYYNLNK